MTKTLKIYNNWSWVKKVMWVYHNRFFILSQKKTTLNNGKHLRHVADSMLIFKTQVFIIPNRICFCTIRFIHLFIYIQYSVNGLFWIRYIISIFISFLRVRKIFIYYNFFKKAQLFTTNYYGIFYWNLQKSR